MKSPQTEAEWQEAFDLANAARMIADARMYGLMEGGPQINLSRCDEIIERGRRRGLQTSKPVAQLAVELVLEINGNGQTA